MDPYTQPNERKVGARRPKISHLPAKIDNGAGGSRATWTGKPERVGEPGGESINRTRQDRQAEKRAVVDERRAIKKAARRNLKKQMLDETDQLD